MAKCQPFVGGTGESMMQADLEAELGFAKND